MKEERDEGPWDMHPPPHQQPFNVLCLMCPFMFWGATVHGLRFLGGLGAKSTLSPIPTAGAQKGKQRALGSSAWLQPGLKGMCLLRSDNKQSEMDTTCHIQVKKNKEDKQKENKILNRIKEDIPTGVQNRRELLHLKQTAHP